MGIQSLKRVLEDYNIEETISLKDLSGKKVGIDTSIYMYKFVNSSSGNYLQMFLYQIHSFLKNRIEPIYIFDGKPPAEKAETLDSRKKDRELREKNGTSQVYPTAEHYIAFENMLRKMGIKFVLGNTEADRVCAKMYANNEIDYGMTEDTDFMTHGVGKVLIGYGVFSPEMKLYNLNKILSSTKLKYEQFVDMCIALGCDYCKKIPNIGPKKCVGFINENGSIENFIQKSGLEYDLERLSVAKSLFMNKDDVEYSLHRECLDKDAVIEMMSNMTIKNAKVYLQHIEVYNNGNDKESHEVKNINEEKDVEAITSSMSQAAL